MAIFIAESDRQSIRSQAVDGVWTAITLTPPAGATGVVVEFRGTTDTFNGEGSVRTIGCGIDGNAAYQLGNIGSANGVCCSQQWAALDGSNQVEIYTNQYCSEARIAGWLEANDITMQPSCTDLWTLLESGDQTTPDTEHIFDVSSIYGGADAMLIRCKGSGASGGATWSFKRPADAWGSNLVRGTNATDFIVPLDATGRVSMRFSHYQPTMYVLGFMGSNFTVYTDPIEVQPLTGSWTNRALLNTSGTANGAMIGHTNTGAVWGGVINASESQMTPSNAMQYGMQYFTGLDANKEFRSYCVDGNIVSMSTFSLGYFDPSSTPTGPSIDQVNGDDIIDHGQTFQVKGQFPTTITGVKITEGGRETSVGFSNQTGTTVDCGPLDVFAGDAQLGSVLIEVTDGTETDTHPITVVSGAGYVDVTLADPILATGAVKELTVAAGQQLAIEAGAGTSVNTLYDDSDMLLNPAAVNGQVYQRHHHDGSTWNSDTITIYRGSFTGVQWIGDLNPPDAVVGKQYDYLFGGLLTGDRPMTFTLATGSLPDGITIDDTAEKITGIATTAISLTGISITADNSVAGASVQVSGDDV